MSSEAFWVLIILGLLLSIYLLRDMIDDWGNRRVLRHARVRIADLEDGLKRYGDQAVAARIREDLTYWKWVEQRALTALDKRKK